MAVLRYIAIFSPDPVELFEAAPELSPQARTCPPDGLLLEVPSRYEQDTYHRISYLVNRECKIGGASISIAAILAAKNSPGTVIAHGKEKAFLASLPIQALTDYGDPEIFHVFSRWGVKTLGELASLPQAALVARVGQQGMLLQRIARGEEIDFFALYQPQPAYEEKQELEYALDSLEPLIFVLGGCWKISVFA